MCRSISIDNQKCSVDIFPLWVLCVVPSMALPHPPSLQMWPASASWPLDQIPPLAPSLSCIQSPGSKLLAQVSQSIEYSRGSSLLFQISQIFRASSFLTFSRPPTWVSKSRRTMSPVEASLAIGAQFETCLQIRFPTSHLWLLFIMEKKSCCSPVPWPYEYRSSIPILSLTKGSSWRSVYCNPSEGALKHVFTENLHYVDRWWSHGKCFGFCRGPCAKTFTLKLDRKLRYNTWPLIHQCINPRVIDPPKCIGPQLSIIGIIDVCLTLVWLLSRIERSVLVSEWK